MIPLIPALISAAATAAPALVGLLGGSERSQQAASAIGHAARIATGRDDQEAAVAALKADPEAMARFTRELREAEARELDAVLADRADARARDVAIRKNGGENWRANIMLGLAFASLVACLYLAYAYTGTDAPVFLTLISTVAGALLKMMSDAFAFEFGSSRGSRDKDAEMADLTRRAAAQAPQIMGAFRRG